MGLWDAYLCISLWPLPRFRSLGKDHRTQALDLMTRSVSQLYKSVTLSWVHAQDPFRGFQETRLKFRVPHRLALFLEAAPCSRDRKATGVGPAESHTSLLLRGQGPWPWDSGPKMGQQVADAVWGSPMCLGSWARGTLPAVGPSVFRQGRLPIYVSSSVLLLW